MLLSKDATIREIHHRVKNNLQTIASLLRLQARRLRSPEAKAALAESERRIRSIAIVHETLSREAGDVVRFSEIVRPLARLVEETASSPELRIRFSVDGDAGELPGEVATPLAVVLNELMQNAVDHAFPEGSQGAQVSRAAPAATASHVVIDVVDNGAGLPDEFSLEGSQGLGLSIVQALVTGELDGSIEMHSNGGTSVRVRVRVSRCRGSSCRRRASSADADLGAGRGPALADPTALLFGEAAPHAGFLVGRQRELEALTGDRALAAHALRRFDLVEGDAGGADREEQFGTRVPARGAVAPRLRVPVVRANPGQRHFNSPF